MDLLLQQRTELVPKHLSDLRTRLVGAEQLMVRQQDWLLAAAVEHFMQPARLRILHAVVVPGGIQSDDLPIPIVQTEKACLALSEKARIAQQEIKIGVA